MRGIHGGVLATAAAEALTSVLIFLNGALKFRSVSPASRTI
jgi:hypothetical protein